MKKLYGFLGITYLFLLVMLLSDCTKDKNNSQTSSNQSITGYVQKGPFINGSSVTVYDLQSNLSPTGKSYNAQIIDNKGTFQLSDIGLSSTYVSLRADGFYFNEISGQQSTSQITLYGLADIAGKSDININLLTHLEKSRVEYLIKNGKTFADSKIQAQKEILAIFNIEKSNIKTSENLNIAESGDDNGILLAITSILQGLRSEGELTELLSNISNDIKEDGTLDTPALGSTLINQALYLDTTSVKNNLAKRYSDIGTTANIPNFGKYLANFISKTKFVATQSMISYPLTGLNGDNVLSLSKTVFSSGYTNYYSFAAQLAQGTSLRIRVTATSADTVKIIHKDSIVVVGYDTTIIALPNPRVELIITKPTWFYVYSSGINWSITDFDNTLYTQTFTATEPGKSCDLKLFFEKGTFLIEYFEMNSLVATRQKTITVK
jgi:hypothetical protein